MKIIRAIALTLAVLPLAAQTVQCPKLEPEPLVRIPEIQAKDHKLAGAVLVSAEQECIGFRVPASAPQKNMTTQWQPQWVRTMRGGDTVPAAPHTPANQYGQPLPGPTFRARVGDLVELTLLNEIDTGVFPYSIDQAEKSEGGGCDQTSTYPKITPTFTDTFPDCFHGSSTANIHFHGTHTNPNSTGDNVFLEVRPLPRDNQGNPTVTRAEATAGFAEFFRRCTEELQNPLHSWPATWDDVPKVWTDKQKELLLAYQQKNPTQRLWDENQAKLKDDWPIYYIGAFPYCFALPEYRGPSGARPAMGQI